MPRPDPALLDPARYPFSCPVAPRFSDLDVNMHINNVAMIDLAQEGRVRLHHASGYTSVGGGSSTVVASLAIEFLGEAFYAETLVSHAAISRIGRTSQVIDQLITQEERVVAWTQAVIVSVKDGQPFALTSAFREAAAEWMLRE